jgi:hypothetical protein
MPVINSRRIGGASVVQYIKGLVLLLVMLDASAQSPLETKHVILITLDGLRWQEVFTGADGDLVSDDNFVDDPAVMLQRYWDDDPALRRQLLMPFFWSVIAEQGQLYGNRAHGSHVDVTNEHWFSYPGYNEILTGFADNRIDSNDKINNTNVTVLEFVNEQAGFRDSVAAFGSWDVFPYIINEQRSGIPVNAGYEFASNDRLSHTEIVLNELQAQIPGPWPTVRFDAFTHRYAMEHLRQYAPRFLYVAYGETDDFAHDGKYDAYLDSARRTDEFIEQIWNWLQSDERYRETTTMFITTDHGRGTEPRTAWEGHGTDVDGSNQIWFAAIGPDTAPLGEIRSQGQYYQNQFASTLAAFLDLGYDGDGKAGRVIDPVIDR